MWTRDCWRVEDTLDEEPRALFSMPTWFLVFFFFISYDLLLSLHEFNRRGGGFTEASSFQSAMRRVGHFLARMAFSLVWEVVEMQPRFHTRCAPAMPCGYCASELMLPSFPPKTPQSYALQEGAPLFLFSKPRTSPRHSVHVHVYVYIYIRIPCQPLGFTCRVVAFRESFLQWYPTPSSLPRFPFAASSARRKAP